MKSRAIFILSGNLSTTPRALKSVLLLRKLFTIDIVLVNRSEVWYTKDKAIINEHVLNVNSVNLGRNPLMSWLWVTLLEKVSKVLFPLFKDKLIINAYASNKSSIVLWHKLKYLDLSSYKLLFAYSAGSLYPSWRLSKKWGIPFFLDIEDYYPGELIRQDGKHEKRRRELLLKDILPSASLITYASPLIGEHCLRLVGEQHVKDHLLVNNSFCASEFNTKENDSDSDDGVLSLVWFSQYIDLGRGLEIILPVLDKYNETCELHLYGEVRADFRKAELEKRNYIQIHGSVTQSTLHHELSLFDVGLAIEDNTQDLNRDLCLTNKIWAYLQSGIFILASGTKAQKRFLKNLPDTGITFESDYSDFEESLFYVLENLSVIRGQQAKRFSHAKSMSWEKDGEKLLKKIQLVCDL